jgi:ATP-dependent helicase/DNAse subunit B
MQDKYTATWVSHSSMGDFIKCPRAYYLHNVYKDPKSRRKINIVNPALSLGVAVHEVVEGLAEFKVEERKQRTTVEALKKSFEIAWAKVSGKKGGFEDDLEEQQEKERAWAMLLRVAENPEPLLHKTVKVKEGENGLPPNYLFSPEDNIILCGKIDWLIYEPKDDSVHILDFKTGKNEESDGSLQLPIYQLLLKNLQKRKVTGASYWYLDRDTKPGEVDLPSLEDSYTKVFKIAQSVKEARTNAEIYGPEEAFTCPRGSDGCYACRPLEQIMRGEAEFVGVGDMRQDLYYIPRKK